MAVVYVELPVKCVPGIKWQDSVMAVNPTTTAPDASLADTPVLRNDATLRPCKVQKRGSDRGAPGANMPAPCALERSSDEPLPKRRKGNVPATETQGKRLRPLAPKLQPNAGVLNILNTQQGVLPLSSSEPVTVLLLCEQARPSSNATGMSLAKPTRTGGEPAITIITSDDAGVVYTMVTRIDDKKTGSCTSTNAMSAPVKESATESAIIGIPSAAIGVEQCVSTEHERQDSALCDSAMLSPTRNLASEPALLSSLTDKTGITRSMLSAVEHSASEFCAAGMISMKEMTEMPSEPPIVGIPSPNFCLEHYNSEAIGRRAPGVCSSSRTMLATAEYAAKEPTVISSPKEKTGLVHSMLTRAEKASELCTSSVSTFDSTKDSAIEPTIIGIPTVNIGTEHSMSETDEKQAYRLCSPSNIKLEPPECIECIANICTEHSMSETDKRQANRSCNPSKIKLEPPEYVECTVNVGTVHSTSETDERQPYILCSPSKIKLEPPEFIECERSFSDSASENSNVVHSPLTAVENKPFTSCTFGNATLSCVADSGSKLADIGVAADATDVEHKTSAVVMEQPAAPYAASSTSLFPAKDIAGEPIVNNAPLDKACLSCSKLTLVENEVFESCASSGETVNCANDTATEPAVIVVPLESADMQHSLSKAVETQASTCTSSELTVIYICNENTGKAPSTLTVPESPTSSPHASSNTSLELVSHMDELGSDSPLRLMPYSSGPPSSTTTFRDKRLGSQHPTIKEGLVRSQFFSEKTKDILRALEHKITVPQRKVMFYREKINSLKLQFHRAQQVMKQPQMLQNFRKLVLAVPHSTDEEIDGS